MNALKYNLDQLSDFFTLILLPEKEENLSTLLHLFLDDQIQSINKESDGKYSIFILSSHLDKFKFDHNNMIADAEEYCCVQVDTENPELDQAGMLSEVTSFFANANIPILCVSTFNFNYIYYKKRYMKLFREEVEKTNGKYKLW